MPPREQKAQITHYDPLSPSSRPNAGFTCKVDWRVPDFAGDVSSGLDWCKRLLGALIESSCARKCQAQQYIIRNRHAGPSYGYYSQRWHGLGLAQFNFADLPDGNYNRSLSAACIALDGHGAVDHFKHDPCDALTPKTRDSHMTADNNIGHA